MLNSLCGVETEEETGGLAARLMARRSNGANAENRVDRLEKFLVAEDAPTSSPSRGFQLFAKRSLAYSEVASFLSALETVLSASAAGCCRDCLTGMSLQG